MRMFMMFILLSGVVFLCSGAIAYAQQNQNKMPSEPLSLEQYQQCQARTKQSNNQALTLQQQQAELEQMKKRITELTRQRDNPEQAVDLHNLQSVEHYNRVNQELNKMANVYSAQAKAFNESLKAYKQEVAALKQECDGRQYIKK